MVKFGIFSLLWWITGNPFLALIVLIVIIYLLDRRYVGIFPSVTRPLQMSQRLSKLRASIKINPHNNSEKLEIARILNGKKRHAEAKAILEQVVLVLDDSAEVWFELGKSELGLGHLELGEEHMLEALRLNPRVAYGEPYLRMGESFAKTNTEKALRYLEQFSEVQSSSCETYYLLGQIYQRIGKTEDARRAFNEVLNIYRVLPRYRKKSERRWAMLARFKV